MLASCRRATGVLLVALPLARGSGAQALPRAYVDLYAAPLYAARFSDAIVTVQAQLHRRLGAESPVTLFLGAALTKDSRSRGGTLPAIFSDNVALLGLGLGAQPGRWVSVRAEAGLALNLVRSVDHPGPTEPDYRVLAAVYRRWEPLGGRRFTEVYGSAGYYSRYRDNGIAYLQLRAGRRGAAGRLYGYLRLNLAMDANRDFFNNAVEAGPGLEWRASGPLSLSARAEYLRGVYFGIEGRDPNPYGPSYHDFRVVLVLGRRWLVAEGRP